MERATHRRAIDTSTRPGSAAAALATDGERLGITVRRDDQQQAVNVGPGVPHAIKLTTELLDQYPKHAPGVPAG